MVYNKDKIKKEGFNMKKTIIKMNGMEFECKVTNYYFGLAIVSIKKVLYPNRKIFRTEFLSEQDRFWIEDYPTIYEGIVKCVENYVDKIIRENDTARKIKEYENGVNYISSYKSIIVPCENFEENT